MGILSKISGRKLYLDANIFIYVLEGFEPWTGDLTVILEAIDTGQASGVTSELTLAECLVKPFSLERNVLVHVYQSFLKPRPGFEVAAVSREILVEASRLRAVEKLKLPDAIHVATALRSRCEVFLTNDQQLKVAGGLEKWLLADLETAH